MLKKLLWSAIMGLIAATLILVVFPQFRSNMPLKITDKVMSFKEAVRIASPAVVNVYNRSFSTSSNADN